MSIKEVLSDFPKIKTKRLTLRKFCLEDAADVFEYISDPEVAKYARWHPSKTVEDAKKLLETRLKEYENHTGGLWGVYHNEDKKVIATVGFFNIDTNNRKAEFGYTFSRKYWGKGYATEVAESLIDFGFNKFGLHRIEGLCHADNHASARVMEKVGMSLEGTLRSYYIKNDKYHDVKIYSIIKNVK